MSSPGPHIVVTLSTITGMRSLKDGIGRIVHLENKQFCQPPIPCNKYPSEWVTTLALKLTSTSVAPKIVVSTIEQNSLYRESYNS